MSLDHIRQKLRAQKTRQAIASQLADTPVGRLASEVDRVARTRSATRATAERLRRQLDSLTRGASREAVARTAVARQIEDIERYARSEGGVWNYLTRKFGPVADAIRGLLQPSGKPHHRQEMEKAAELLNALGVGTEGAKGRRVSVQANDPETRAEAERTLKALGFDVQPSVEAPAEYQPGSRLPSRPWSQAPRTRLPDRVEPAVPVDPTNGMERRILGGMYVYFNPNDPILTGAMIPVKSSNVHSIGYDWNDKTPERGTLKVRFLDHQRGGAKTGKGGATYFYHDVHPRVFMDFQRAASKGKFVWDRLRVRGTVSQHQYRYSLARISSTGYVPRQATLIGNEEWYMQRTVQTADGGTLKSQLQNRLVRKMRPDQMKPRNGRPGSGRPRDGRPNDGSM